MLVRIADVLPAMKTASSYRKFIGYGRRGNGPKWKAALLDALQGFEQHLLNVWQHGKTRDSSFSDDDITRAVTSARVAVVLLTPASVPVQYILENEN